jgi:translocation and assembly module TamB
MRRFLRAVALLGILAIVLGAWAITTESGLRAVAGFAIRFVPGELALGSVEGNLLEGITVEDIRYRDPDLSVEIARASARWRWLNAGLGGVEMEAVRIERPRVAVRRFPAGDDERGAVALPSPIRMNALVISEPAFRYLDRDLALPRAIESRLELRGTRLSLERLQLEFEQGTVDASGELEFGEALSFRAGISADGALPDWGAVSARLEANGTGTLFVVESLEVSLGEGQARLSGSVDLSPAGRVRIAGDWRDLPVTPRSQGTAPSMTGRITAEGSVEQLAASGEFSLALLPLGDLHGNFALARDGDRIRIERLEVRHGARGVVSARGSANIAAAPEPTFELTTSWRDLELSQAGRGTVASQAGSVTIAGTAGAYEMSFNASLSGERLPSTQVEGRGRGNRRSLDLRSLQVSTLNGAIEGSVGLEWSPAPRVSASLTATRLDPGVQWPLWAGDVSLSVTGDAAMQGDAVRARVASLTGNGTLRGRSFDVSARDVTFDGAELTVAALDLNAGQSSLSLAGRYSPSQSDLEFSLAAPNLSELLPEAAGHITANGYLKAERNVFDLRARAEGGEIAVRGVKVEGLTVDTRIGMAEDAPVNGSIVVRGLAAGEQEFASLRVDLEGIASQHRALLRAERGTDRLSATLAGAFKDSQWMGEISGFELLSDMLGQWRLEHSARLHVSRASQTLGPLCITSVQSRLCLEGDNSETQAWRASVGVMRLPLALLTPLVKSKQLSISGALDAEFGAAGQGEAIGKLTLDARTDGIEVAYAIDEEFDQRVAIDSAIVSGHFAEGTLTLQTEVRAPRHMQRPMTFDARLTHFEPANPSAPEAGVQASLIADWTDLSAVPVLVPQLASAAGRASANLRVAGRVGDPRFVGEVGLEDAAFEVPRAGIKIEDVNLMAMGDPRGGMQLSGSLRSGRGEANLTGSVRVAGGVRVKAALEGRDFEVVNTPAARVYASPAIDLEWIDDTVSVKGAVRIPEAFIEPLEIPAMTGTSSDVVVVGLPAPEAVSAPIAVNVDVRVDLGDKVTAKSRLFDLTLSGGLRVGMEPNRAARGTGEIGVEGQVSAYGAKLAVRDGRLIFAGDLEEPRLDVRAIRTVGSVTAGIRVAGVVTAPAISLFSTPAMAQDRILSYLVLGRPLDKAGSGEGSSLVNAATTLGIENSEIVTGGLARKFALDELSLAGGETLQDTSLVIGKYLSPKLYLSYGIGVFEPVGTARLRYDLNERWSIQVEQGEETGADVFFRIER